MPNFSALKPPTNGSPITRKNGQLVVPDDPIIPFIEGDGTGRDIWRRRAACLTPRWKRHSAASVSVVWYEVFAGEKAFHRSGEWLPEGTLDAITAFRIAIKGPLTTPVGGGIRSLNVALRQLLDLYACVRPVRYFAGVPSPVKHPEQMNVVIFRENTEDVYAGIEWREGNGRGPAPDRVSGRRTMGKKDPRGLGHRHQADVASPGPSGWCGMAIQYALDQQAQA